MSSEELIEGIKAADIGPFREVRLITLVHHRGATPDVRAQIAREIREVVLKERADNEQLKAYIKELDRTLQDLSALSQTAKKVTALKHKVAN